MSLPADDSCGESPDRPSDEDTILSPKNYSSRQCIASNYLASYFDDPVVSLFLLASHDQEISGTNKVINSKQLPMGLSISSRLQHFLEQMVKLAYFSSTQI